MKEFTAKSDKQRAYALDMIESMEAKYNGRIDNCNNIINNGAYEPGNTWYSKKYYEHLADFYNFDRLLRRNRLDDLDNAGDIIQVIKNMDFNALDVEAAEKTGSTLVTIAARSNRG